MPMATKLNRMEIYKEELISSKSYGPLIIRFCKVT